MIPEDHLITSAAVGKKADEVRHGAAWNEERSLFAEALRGQALTPEAIREAAEVAARDDVDPSNDINASAEYRRHLVRVLSRRALTEAAERARGTR